MEHIRKAFEIEAKMKQCHKTLNTLNKGDFKEKVAWYIERIQKVMLLSETDVLNAIIIITNLPSVANSAIAQMWFMAAAVEMLQDDKPNEAGV